MRGKILVLGDLHINIPNSILDKKYPIVFIHDVKYDINCPVSQAIRMSFVEAAAVVIAFDIKSTRETTLRTLDRCIRTIVTYGGPYVNKPIIIVGDGTSESSAVSRWVSLIRDKADSSFARHNIRINSPLRSQIPKLML
jgi:hypothetical protein